MRLAFLVVLLVACGPATSPSDDLAAVFTDVDLAGYDLAQSVDMSIEPDLAWTDLAGGVDIAMPDAAKAPDMRAPVDMAKPVDMACADVPTCGPPLAQLGCCNGALHCVNGYCQNTTGEVCNTNPSNGPVVTCFGGKSCGGVCN